jgi:hypothetical protein
VHPDEGGRPHPEPEPHASNPADLVLHGPRVLGFASAGRIADRFRLDPALVSELLLDFEAVGWVRRSAFAGDSGWSITEAGRAEGERRLAGELDRLGIRHLVTAVHADFVPLNRQFGRACTDWQIRPVAGDGLAANDHTDWGWDERVLRDVAALGRSFGALADHLAARLQRFAGYSGRYAGALARVDAGDRRWMDAPEVDSCHTIWIQLHEDLLATLGVPRGADA